ncbi:MAG: DUF1385 domain-containing protein [Lachnospiraceae bacterium]|nr:DUF1385 domain-containing protein [Lachnospiraceae bacterium]
MAKKKHSHYSGIGGQAVLEGVMMKNKEKYAVAVRKPNGEIEVELENHQGVGCNSVFKNLPFIRGIFNFVDSMVLGTRCLNFSAEFYEDEEEQETKFDKFLNKITGGKAEKVLSAFVVAFSVILAAAIFIVLPYFITSLFKAYVRSSILMTIIEGCIRILIFLLYVVGISAMKDIKRLYMYHGAEHKCINCIERGKPLTVRNVMRSSRLHKRCGTSFMFFVLFISIILFFFIQVSNPVLKIVLRILLIPVIAGISYEIIRLAGRSDNIFIKILSAPGMAIQKLTTKEPTKDMVEVGIASVEAVFDWKKFLIEEFNYDPSYFEEESSENTEEDEQA